MMMRLCRGLTKQYRPDYVGKGSEGRWCGTDFSDCPYAALGFAQGTRGVVLLLDVPREAFASHRVTEELWGFNKSDPKRWMVWGRFGRWLVAEIPAKELRAQVRKKGNRYAAGYRQITDT